MELLDILTIIAAIIVVIGIIVKAVVRIRKNKDMVNGSEQVSETEEERG